MCILLARDIKKLLLKFSISHGRKHQPIQPEAHSADWMPCFKWQLLSISSNLTVQIALRLPHLILSENWTLTGAKDETEEHYLHYHLHDQNTCFLYSRGVKKSL